MSLPLPLVLATQNADKAREIVEIFVQHAAEPLAARTVLARTFVAGGIDSAGT